MPTNTVTVHRTGPHWGRSNGSILTVVDGVGVIDSDAKRAFTEGQCHCLALALHEQSGWPTVVDADVANGDDWWGHVCVRHPDGDLVDIEGKHPGAHKVGRFGWAGTFDINPEDVPDLPHAFAITEEGMATAHCFARAVLQDLES